MVADRRFRFPPPWAPSLSDKNRSGRAMKTSFEIAFVAAAGLVSSSSFAQQVVIPRELSAQGYMVQKASGGYLGIGGLDISPDRAKALNLKEERGVEVSSLADDGPAAKAGIKQGD